MNAQEILSEIVSHIGIFDEALEKTDILKLTDDETVKALHCTKAFKEIKKIIREGRYK